MKEKMVVKKRKKNVVNIKKIFFDKSKIFYLYIHLNKLNGVFYFNNYTLLHNSKIIIYLLYSFNIFIIIKKLLQKMYFCNIIYSLITY